MSEVINLNRYRKRRAREEKERQAETNRRLHGRTKAERRKEAADRQRLEKQLAGAFLVPERVPVEHLAGDPEQTLWHLEQATRDMPTLSQFSERLRARNAHAGASQPASEEPSKATPRSGLHLSAQPGAKGAAAEQGLGPQREEPKRGEPQRHDPERGEPQRDERERAGERGAEPEPSA